MHIETGSKLCERLVELNAGTYCAKKMMRYLLKYRIIIDRENTLQCR